MGRKRNRFLLLIVSCSAAGVVLGGTTSWSQSNQCLHVNTVVSECLTQDPVVKTIQGMSTGLIAGAGAALGAVWQLRQEE